MSGRTRCCSRKAGFRFYCSLVPVIGRVAGVAVAVVAATVACGSTEPDPYAGLTAAEMAYVIPDSAQWGPGDPCADLCAGEVTTAEMQLLAWSRVRDIEVVDGRSGAESLITVRLRVDEGGDPAGDFVTRSWGEDVASALAVLEQGYELWAGVGEPPDDWVRLFVVFDDGGRFAGVGYNAAGDVTVPLAREMASHGAPSARAFLRGSIDAH